VDVGAVAATDGEILQRGGEVLGLDRDVIERDTRLAREGGVDPRRERMRNRMTDDCVPLHADSFNQAAACNAK
jgi:hypothetical protein